MEAPKNNMHGNMVTLKGYGLEVVVEVAGASVLGTILLFLLFGFIIIFIKKIIPSSRRIKNNNYNEEIELGSIYNQQLPVNLINI